MAMARRVHVVGSFVIALACIRCSFLVDDGGLIGGGDAVDATTATDAPHAADAPIDARADASSSDARDAAAFPDGARVWAGNGHGYEVVVVDGGITWTSAKADAVGRGGHLATLTSEDENTFVYLLTAETDGAWTSGGTNWLGPLVGGEQVPSPSAAADAGWTWVTGEPFGYAAWWPTEPNDALGEETVIEYFAATSKGPTWADYLATGKVKAYVVEYE